MWKLCGVLVFLVTVQSASLPDYIKPCAISDPNFNECALQHAQEALPQFIKGDRKLKLFPLDPLEIVELKLDEGNNRGIAYKLQKAKVTGFKNAQFETINFDLKNDKFFIKFTVPVLTLLGKYDVNGRLLILPITGHGDLNSTTVEAKITFEGNMKREEKDGKKYIKVVDPTIKMVPKRVYISMTNLFNGNELLGREMNEFMNKNWKEVNEEISPPVEQAIAEIVVGGINQLLGSTPEENLFPEKLP